MLRLNQLTYRIGGRVLLDSCSAAINAGHRVGLVGRNGTGKTTTCAKLAHRIQQDGGVAVLAACDTFRAAAGEPPRPASLSRRAGLR